MATIPNYPREAAEARQANAAFYQAIDDIMGARATMDTLHRIRSENGLSPRAKAASLRVATRLGDATHGPGMAAAYNAERAANGGMPAVEDVPGALTAVQADAEALWTKLGTALSGFTRTLTEDGDGYLVWSEPAGSTIRDALQPEVGTLHASLGAAVGAEV